MLIDIKPKWYWTKRFAAIALIYGCGFLSCYFFLFVARIILDNQ
jgi:hypothetical protein